MDTAASQPEAHISATKQRLEALQPVAEKTNAAEQKILEHAQDLRARTLLDLEKLRPRALINAEAAQQYVNLTMEIGALDTVIANSLQALGQ